MATWPATLPQQPLADNYSSKARPQVAASDNQIGPPTIRRRSTARVVEHQWSQVLTAAQRDTLNTWYDAELFGGSIRFDAPIPGSAGRAFFVMPEPPEFNGIAGRLYRVTMTWIQVP